MRKFEKENFYKKITLYFLFVFFGYFSGLKPFGKWVDYEGYHYIYETSILNSYSDLLGYNDFLFYYIIKFFSFLDFQHFYAICSSFTTFFILRFGYKKSKNFILFLILYFSMLYWIQVYTQVRLGLSLAFFLTGLLCYEKNKKTFSLTLITISLLIHNSIIIPIGILFFSFLFKKKFFKFSLLTPFIIYLSAKYFSNIDRINIYIQLMDSGFFDEFNYLSPSPILLFIINIIILLSGEKNTHRESIYFRIGFFAPILYWSLGFIPVLAYRSYELLAFFLLIHLSSTKKLNFAIQFLLFIYIFLSLRTSIILLYY